MSDAIVFTQKQAEAMDAIASEAYDFILFGGAMGGGKTFWGLSALLIMCQVFPRSRWCVVREDLEKIRITTIPSFMKLNASGKLRTNPYEYTHPNGSVIMFKGENYDKDKELQWLKGLEVNGFLFEEINECSEDTFNISFGRAGRWECKPRPKPIILATCNPTSNWVKKRVYDKFNAGELPSNWLYIPSKITDNDYLTDDYKRNLENLPRYQYEMYVNGNWDLQLKQGGEFYKCFELDKHVGRTVYDPSLPLHISWDDNVNPYLPLGIFQLVGKRVMAIDEIAGENPRNTVKEVCREFIRRYPSHTSGLFVYGDATANKDDTKLEKGYNFYRLILEELKDYRPTSRVLRSNPSVVMRGNWLNTVLEKEIGGVSVVIGENCKKMIADLVNLKEAADGTKSKEMETDPRTKVRYQKLGHFSDLFDYIMVAAFGSEFENYQRGGSGISINFGKNKPSKNSY
jgi:hypothetical protein